MGAWWRVWKMVFVPWWVVMEQRDWIDTLCLVVKCQEREIGTLRDGIEVMGWVFCGVDCDGHRVLGH